MGEPSVFIELDVPYTRDHELERGNIVAHFGLVVGFVVINAMMFGHVMGQLANLTEREVQNLIPGPLAALTRFLMILPHDNLFEV